MKEKKEYETPKVIETLTEEQVFGTEDLMASAWGNVWGNSWGNSGGCLRKCIVAF